MEHGLSNEVKLHYDGTQINSEVDLGVLDYSQKRWYPVHMYLPYCVTALIRFVRHFYLPVQPYYTCLLAVL